MRTGIRKRTAERVDTAPALRDRVERQLAAAANAQPASHDDPLYSVTEAFQQDFQRIGRRRAEAEEDAERSEEEKRPEQPESLRAQGPQSAEQEQDEGRAPVAQKLGTPPRTREREDAAPMQKFSTMAFQRGELSAAVMEGTGKLALISCLKRAIGKSERSATLFGLGAQTRNVPARDPDKMMFHRNFAHSAVGLVVDTLRDARQTVESLTDMATGAGELREQDGGATLRTMYPFLDDSRERALLAERRERLKGDCTTEERAILENAAVRAEALIAKKARMKENFIQKLREVSDRAADALAELEAPETLEEVVQALIEDEPSPPPPDDEAPEVPGEEDAESEENVPVMDDSEAAPSAEGAGTEESVFTEEDAETSGMEGAETPEVVSDISGE